MQNHAMMFIQDLAIIMLVAGLITILCHRFKQPIVLGYIIAGIIIGPYTPPFSFISDMTTIKTLAELGVIFLMFSMGLEFNLHKIKNVGGAAFIAVFAEITLMIWLGYQIGIAFHWSQTDAIFLGAILSISSTTIIVKALTELGLKKEAFAQLIFGILVLEDMFAIVILALLSTSAISGSLYFKDIIIIVAKLSSFLVVSLLLGILIVPRLISYLTKFDSNEMLLISVLGLCFGFCLLVVKLNYSVALGAFIIGAILAESKQLPMIEHLIAPLRDMFSAIFFVSVGLLFDPRIIANYLIPIIVITIAVIIGKVLTGSLGVLLTGRDGKTALRVGMGLAQIGEFSFIIATLGITLDVTGSFLYPLAVTVSAITTLFTPYLIKYSDSVAQYSANYIPKDIKTFFRLYGTWVKNLDKNVSETRSKYIKNGIIHIVINLLIVTAIFFVCSYFAKTVLGHFLIKITNQYIQKTLIWGTALIFSLPFLIAIYRKTKGLSALLTTVNENDTKVIIKARKVVAGVIPFISIIGLIIFISLLSASILPPLELIILVITVLLVFTPLIFPLLVKLHSRLHGSVVKVWKKNSEHK